MIDYKLLEALAWWWKRAVSSGGAAPGAVAIGGVPAHQAARSPVGQAVLVRETPPQPTAPGLRLLRHIQQVRLLEADLGSDGRVWPKRRRSACASPLTPTACQLVAAGGRPPGSGHKRVLLDLVVEDQDVVLRRIAPARWRPASAPTASRWPAHGSAPWGPMRYRALASPEFRARQLAALPYPQALARAPAIVFGPDDRLQHRYLEQLGVTQTFDYHLCPSAEGFLQMTLGGIGWGLLRISRARLPGRGARWWIWRPVTGWTCRCSGITGAMAAPPCRP